MTIPTATCLRSALSRTRPQSKFRPPKNKYFDFAQYKLTYRVASLTPLRRGSLHLHLYLWKLSQEGEKGKKCCPCPPSHPRATRALPRNFLEMNIFYMTPQLDCYKALITTVEPQWTTTVVNKAENPQLWCCGKLWMPRKPIPPCRRGFYNALSFVKFYLVFRVSHPPVSRPLNGRFPSASGGAGGGKSS